MRIGLILVSIIMLGIHIANAETSEPTITIRDAQYGKVNNVNATAGVGKLCNGLTSCTFRVEPAVMNVPDPVPNVEKDLRISWSCGNKGMQALVYKDYQEAQLSCGQH